MEKESQILKGDFSETPLADESINSIPDPSTKEQNKRPVSWLDARLTELTSYSIAGYLFQWILLDTTKDNLSISVKTRLATVGLGCILVGLNDRRERLSRK